MYDIIQKKRNGGALSDAEISFFVNGYTRGEIPDYQASALCMAIWFRGMSVEETTALTLAIRDSGECLHLQAVDGLRVDKHSTGGVGDKTSLVIAPVVASLGVKLAKMSGRGLGHTGGTVDKLEAIRGFRTDLTVEEFERTVREVGLSIVGQSADLAPADKLLYALRDVTATVDSMPLIASSIMGKKLAADDDCIVLDVKCGSGAFMKSEEESRELAELMVQIGRRAGKRMCALVTDMDRPLGNTIGNALEVYEAIEVLQGGGPEDLRTLCVALATQMLLLAEYGDRETCQASVERVLADGTALRIFAAMVKAQGGDCSMIEQPERLLSAPYSCEVKATVTGYIARVDTERYGVAALQLGAGRNTKEDVIDLSAGIRLLAKTGDFVKVGDTIAVLYASDPSRFDAAKETLTNATFFSHKPPLPRKLIMEIIQ